MITRVAWVVVVSLGIAAVPSAWWLGWPAIPESAPHNEKTAAARPTSPGAIGDAGGLLHLAIEWTPFRLARRAPAVRFGGTEPNVPSQSPGAAPAPKPVLVLSGILWGSEPAAILEGVPGQAGAVVLHPGESSGPIRIKSIDRTRVLVAGPDTAWTLWVRVPWP